MQKYMSTQVFTKDHFSKFNKEKFSRSQVLTCRHTDTAKPAAAFA